MELLDNPLPAAAAAQSYGKGARRKNRFKGSDGSTSSDTTSNSFVRQGHHSLIHHLEKNTRSTCAVFKSSHLSTMDVIISITVLIYPENRPCK
ncbi:hypothetical protein Y1Q_0014378 [Alligator mississippiensis]|uniref:Uncharacterized protein n=1 Tax=Alligator mississippiensis TaxID=8496 RepID=A0A151PDB2_ALLMI|nr:hypothetical protein Y1Q_0014378 [Alligator mississippiensis]